MCSAVCLRVCVSAVAPSLVARLVLTVGCSGAIVFFLTRRGGSNSLSVTASHTNCRLAHAAPRLLLMCCLYVTVWVSCVGWPASSVSELVQQVTLLPEQQSSTPSAASAVALTPLDFWLPLAAPSVQHTLLTSILACLHEVVEREAVPSVSQQRDTRQAMEGCY